MFNPRSLKVCLLAVMVLGSSLLQGCNPLIIVALITATPAVINMISDVKTSHDKLAVERLAAETARTNAVSTSAEKTNQQVVAQRTLEAELIKLQIETKDPAIRAQLANLQAKVAEDQKVISQTLNTANNEANNLANDKGPLPGTTSGSTSIGGTAGTPLTPAAAGNPTAPATTTQPVAATGAPLSPGIVGSGAVVDPSTATGVAPRVEGYPVVAPTVTSEVTPDPASGAVSSAAVPNPRILGVSAPAASGGM